MKDFFYQDPYPVQKDTTKYRLLTKDHITVTEANGRRIVRVAPEALELLARTAFTDVSFFLRASHLNHLTQILNDYEASGMNDLWLIPCL